VAASHERPVHCTGRFHFRRRVRPLGDHATLTGTGKVPKLRRTFAELHRARSPAANMGVNDFSGTTGLPPQVAFGDFRLDTARVEVTYQGRPLALRPKAYALLCYLLAHPGRTLGKQELMSILWPSVVVTDDSLVQCVADLRTALGPHGAHLVTTVPRHGYRFDGVLEPAAEATSPPASPLPSSLPSPAPSPAAAVARRWTWPRVVGVMAVVASAFMLTAWALWPRPPVNADQAFSRERSLVVLPLVPQGSETTKAFADAMTDELIGDIARLPGTTVMARASAAAAAVQEQDLRRLARLLDVAYVVTGTVTREDQAVEVALQFVSATTGAVLWSERWRQADAETASRRGDIRGLQGHCKQPPVAGHRIAGARRPAAAQFHSAGRRAEGAGSVPGSDRVRPRFGARLGRARPLVPVRDPVALGRGP
jgi:DNA-binding winged helix-turn-helix (wHTH) protein/TolB-like protein